MAPKTDAERGPQTSMNTIIRIIKWLYTQMLRLYPLHFRVNYRAEMQAVFSERLANCSGAGSSIWILLREMCDLPGAVILQYHLQTVWALSATHSTPTESDLLEDTLKRKFYRRQIIGIVKVLLFIVLSVIAIRIHGYLFSVYLIHQSEQEFGIYTTLDEAIQASDQQYAKYYRNIDSVSITAQGPINAQNDFIWEVHANVHAESLADGSPITPRHTGGKMYYIHTRDGWVPYVKEFWIEVGFLTHWMKFYHLYGE